MAFHAATQHTKPGKGARAPAVTYPVATAPKELTDKIYKWKNKYGAEVLYQILGRDGTGAEVLGDVDGLGQPVPKTAGSYPVRLYAPDPYDTEVALKAQVGDQMGQRTLMQSDLDWLKRKQDQMTAAEFKQFVASMYNINDPAQLARMNKVYPELFDEQMQIINERFDLAKRLAVMAATGEPQSREDLQLLFALNTGAIKLPTGDPWDPKTWTSSGVIADTKQQAMARGLFSPITGSVAGTGNSAYTPFSALKWATKKGGLGRQDFGTITDASGFRWANASSLSSAATP